MTYKTLYEISGSGMECFDQVFQDLFHAHHDLFHLASYSNMMLGMSIAIPIFCTAIMIGIVEGVRLLMKRPKMTKKMQVSLLALGIPVSMVLIVGGLLGFYVYPHHMHMVQKLADGHHSTVEGAISDTKIAHGGRNNNTRAVFKVGGKQLVIYANDVGFDDPEDPAICNGQYVRIQYLDQGDNPPVVLKVEVREPAVTKCERATENW